MRTWEYLFWISCLLIIYNYAGYAFIAYFFNVFKKKKALPSPVTDDDLPYVSFIVAAYNEEDCIETKIKNSLEQDYPEHKIEFLFITDGSSDNTMEIIKRYPAIQLLHQQERKGKSAALNRVVAQANNDILIFSDANALLNKEATRLIASHYLDKKVGGVAGEKKVLATTQVAEQVGVTEGFYWKYESFLKKIDSEFYSVVGAAGELFSVRKKLYTPVSEKVILDDFIISLKVAEMGYRVMYEPSAYAAELPSASITDEKIRKIRISAGGFQSIVLLKSLLLFWKNPRLSFLYISHRVMRWLITPFCLVIALISNAALCFYQGTILYKSLFFIQLLFYSAAVLSQLSQRLKILKFCHYFVFMNISVIQGFFVFLSGKQSAAWKKAKRTIV